MPSDPPPKVPANIGSQDEIPTESTVPATPQFSHPAQTPAFTQGFDETPAPEERLTTLIASIENHPRIHEAAFREATYDLAHLNYLEAMVTATPRADVLGAQLVTALSLRLRRDLLADQIERGKTLEPGYRQAVEGTVELTVDLQNPSLISTVAQIETLVRQTDFSDIQAATRTFTIVKGILVRTANVSVPNTEDLSS